MRTLSFIMFVLLTGQVLFTQMPAQDKVGKESAFVGEWTLDLRPSPDAAAYIQTLTIGIEANGKFSGRFYGSPIQEVFLNDNWDKLYFAFMSSDSSYDYFHTGYIIGDQIFGTSYCPGRDFIMPWTGMKKEN